MKNQRNQNGLRKRKFRMSNNIWMPKLMIKGRLVRKNLMPLGKNFSKIQQKRMDNPY